MPSKVAIAHRQDDNGLLRMVKLSALALVLTLAQATVLLAQDRPESFADLAERVSPAVVNITTRTTVARRLDDRPRLPEGSPFEDFFRDFLEEQDPGRRNRPQRPRQGQALGSGFVISPEGFIVTNNHVIDGADEIIVEFFSGLTLDAELVGTDPATDIALLRLILTNPFHMSNSVTPKYRASGIGFWPSVTRWGRVFRSAPGSSRPVVAHCREIMTTTSRPTLPSTAATLVVRCSIWTEM